jgi:hypothetical protein
MFYENEDSIRKGLLSFRQVVRYTVIMFKKEKKPFIKFVSTVEGLENIPECLPKLATKYIPEWFKNVPANLDFLQTQTVRLCPSFSDLFSSAYVVPAWEDSVLRYNKEIDHWSASTGGISNWSTHGNKQMLDYVESSVLGNKTQIIFKSDCPWKVITAPGYSVLQLPMFYHFNKDWTALPGIIDTDIYHEINQQILYHSDKDEVRIARGTPLAMYIPYKRSKFNFSTNFMTEEESKKFQTLNMIFRGKLFTSGIYKNLQKERDR